MIKKTGLSLEETIRAVEKKYRNRPSPLAMMNENSNIGYAPQQVAANSPPTSKNIRNALVGDFVPPHDTFR